MKNKIDIERGRYWDFGWQLISSCSRCSLGCDNCWSLAKEKRFHEGIEGKIEVHPERLNIPSKRKKSTVYALWNDAFHEQVGIGFITHAYDTMSDCPQHTFLVLTKRPERIYPMLYGRHNDGKWRYMRDGESIPNLYLGLTVCNQQEWNEKGKLFLSVPGKKFISHEPALERIDYGPELKEISCLIAGGETGAKARPSHSDAFRSDRDQCSAAGVLFFLKHISKKDGRLLDGRTHDDLPWYNKTKEAHD